MNARIKVLRRGSHVGILYSGKVSQQTRDVDPMLVYFWASVADGGPKIDQHWVNVSCLLASIPAKRKIVEPKLIYCWSSGVDGELTLIQHWFNVFYSQIGLWSGVHKKDKGGPPCCRRWKCPVIKDLRLNKITSKGFLANLKSLGHVIYMKKSYQKCPWGNVQN